MKRIIGGGVAVVALLAAGLGAAVLMQTDLLQAERSVRVTAGMEDVEPLLVDMKGVTSWSPWVELDPDLTQSYSSETTGVGAWYAWEGDENVGKGKQTIQAVEPGKVVHDIGFVEPFAGHATSTLTWKADGDEVVVTWGFQQPTDLPTKMALLFMDIEGMVGADYERGLGYLKPLAEKAAHARKAEAELEAQKAALLAEAAEKAADAEQASDE